MLIKRYLFDYVLEDLNEKMVFISGARQVGKTTLCKHIGETSFKKFLYLNWDNRQDRKIILNSLWQPEAELIIFDEIHKYRTWKNFIKGEYDKNKEKYKFLVTGSSRLDIYRKTGDSLQGRYHHYVLHPFSLSEIENLKPSLTPFKELVFTESPSSSLSQLLKFGGFPEPFIKQSERHLRRWHNEKVERLFKEEIRELTLIREVSNMKLLSDILPTKVGSLLSLNSLREDLEVSYKAVQNWIEILEAFYYCFRIYPYNYSKIRALKKEPKLYLWDWSEVEDESYRFENLIASHLLKTCHFLKDYLGYKAELCFLRDVDKREVDFVVVVDNKVWFAVEVKKSDKNISPHMFYFKERLHIPYTYQVAFDEGVDFEKDGVRVISASKFLTGVV